MPSAVQPPPAKARANIALTTHGASASTPQYHNGASVAAASVTMDAANAFGLAGAVHAVSAASLAAGSNSTVPLDQFYWICRACSYTNEEDISRAVFGNTDEGSRVCVICYITSDKKTPLPHLPRGKSINDATVAVGARIVSDGTIAIGSTGEIQRKKQARLRQFSHCMSRVEIQSSF